MNTISFNTTVNCPTCFDINYVDIEATYEYGEIPKTEHKCSSCSGKFIVMATVDIDVEIDE